jgi:tRNA pseudouridine13 synthase
MKLKRLPEDFQVEEEISLQPASGPFALYRLTKESLSTLEAVRAVAQRWKLNRSQLAFTGLKDKHAQTTQYITIERGPRRGLSQSNLQLNYVGQVSRAIGAEDIAGNRFVVVIRELTLAEMEGGVRELAFVAADGLPNYFDDQRFGSLGRSGQFIARSWCLGDFEQALKLALTDARVADLADERNERTILREQWGDWQACLNRLPKSPWRAMLSFLADQPGDFRRAIALAPHELRSLWLAAFQSHLWNQVLAAHIQQVCRPSQCLPRVIAGRELPFFVRLEQSQRDQLHRALLPLPSARLHLNDHPLEALYKQVLSKEGLELRQIRVKYPRDSFFSKGERPAVVQPRQLEHETAADELYAKKHKLTLRFLLPRGSYATLLVKRITTTSTDDLSEDDQSPA